MAEETKQATTSSDAWTVMKLLNWTTDFFRKKGSESPRLDAEVLLAHARDSSRIELYTAFDTEPTEEQREAFREMVRRRGEGAPVAYLVGYREFYSLRLRVSESVLIPRPETEHVVIEALDLAKRIASSGDDRPLQIVDVGTGSGAIAVAIAKHLPTASVTAIDVSPDALAIAKWNVDQLGLGDRVTLVQGDLLEPIAPGQSTDIIVSNPPYVSEAEYADLSPSVKNHEPKLALVSGQKGTEIIFRLLNDAPSRLRAGGQIIIELSPMIADQCLQHAQQSGHYDSARLIKDLAGHKRVLSARRA